MLCLNMAVSMNTSHERRICFANFNIMWERARGIRREKGGERNREMPEKCLLFLQSYPWFRSKVKLETSSPPYCHSVPLALWPWLDTTRDSTQSKWKILFVFVIYSLSGPLNWTIPATNHTVASIQEQRGRLTLEVIMKMLTTSHSTWSSTWSWSLLVHLISSLQNCSKLDASSSPKGLGSPSWHLHLPFSETGISAPLHSFWFNLPHWLLYSWGR